MKKRILSAILAALMLISVTACESEGGIENQIENMSDEELEDAISEGIEKLEETEKEEETTASEEEPAEAEETEEVEALYTPSQEILDASLDSGLIQIGNDIFRNGGYLTVAEFMEEYGDTYELINPERDVLDAAFPGDWARRISMVNKEDPGIKIIVYFDYSPDNSRILKDGVVTRVQPTGDHGFQYSWDACKIRQEEIRNDILNGGPVSYFDENGFTQVDFFEITGKEIDETSSYSYTNLGESPSVFKEYAGKYGKSGVHFENNNISYSVFLKYKDVNLYGENPVYRFIITHHKNDDTITFEFSRMYSADNVIFASI